jgi:hypothetical protein
MTKNNILTFESKRREGGRGQTQRDYLDFVIDGEALSEKIQGDFVSCLAWSDKEDTEVVRRLLLEYKTDFPDNRQSLYVCAECGDLGCGAVSAVIEETGDKIVWRDFGYQNDYEETIHFDNYTKVKSFTFDKVEYEKVIKTLFI